MFDTHTHLNFPDLPGSLDETLMRACTVGVTHFLIPGTDLKNSRKAVDMAKHHDNIYAAVGLHPSDVGAEPGKDQSKVAADLAEIEELLVSSPKVLAIGEVGLDYYDIFVKCGGSKAEKPLRDAALEVQKKHFRVQAEMAIKHNKSLILHCRQARKPLLEVLHEIWKDSLRNRVVFHCCEPEADILEFAIKHDAFMGFDGDLTYNQAKQTFIQHVPLERIVLETDSPFLTPEPLRQTKKFPNEPANLKYVADAVAQFKGISYEDVVTQSMENSFALFDLKK